MWEHTYFVKQVFFLLSAEGFLVDMRAFVALHLGGTPSQETGTSPPSCLILDNCLYIRILHQRSVTLCVYLSVTNFDLNYLRTGSTKRLKIVPKVMLEIPLYRKIQFTVKMKNSNLPQSMTKNSSCHSLAVSPVLNWSQHVDMPDPVNVHRRSKLQVLVWSFRDWLEKWNPEPFVANDWPGYDVGVVVQAPAIINHLQEVQLVDGRLNL